MKRARRIGLILLIVIAVLLVLPYLVPLPAGTDPQQLADPNGRFLAVDGLQAYIIEAGPADGPAVVLVHGLGGSTFTWRENIAPLAEAGYRVVAIDRPGFGLTEKPLSYDYSPAHQADFIAALLDALDIAQATLIGHSAGGNIIAYTADRHPERVERLVFVSGAVVGQSFSGAIGWLFHFPPLARWVQVGVNTLITEDRFVELLASAAADPDFVTPEIAAGYARVLQTPNWPASFVGMVRDGSDSRLSDSELAALNIPALLMWGEDDTWVPLENGERLLGLLPDADLITYPGIGHLAMEEAPEAFNADLLAFLAE